MEENDGTYVIKRIKFEYIKGKIKMQRNCYTAINC